MFDQKVEDFGIAAAPSAPAAVGIHAGRYQERRRPHTDNVGIGALVEQGPHHLDVTVHGGAKQRRHTGAEESIAETPALIARTAHAELGIRIDAGVQQGGDDVHARDFRTDGGRRQVNRRTTAAPASAAAPETTAPATVLSIDDDVERRASIYIPNMRIGALIQQ